eukprot:m51a1_g11469 hypothetical protein (225) ;mRNA; f:165-1071
MSVCGQGQGVGYDVAAVLRAASRVSSESLVPMRPSYGGSAQFLSASVPQSVRQALAMQQQQQQQQPEVPSPLGGAGVDYDDPSGQQVMVAGVAGGQMMGDPQGMQGMEGSGALEPAGQGTVANIIASGQRYVDITEYLTMPQSEAARKLSIPTSTLSKRWKEAVRGRKWPYRTVAKCDKEIMTLLHNIPQGTSAHQLPEDVEASLAILMRKRQEELKPVIIRLS